MNNAAMSGTHYPLDKEPRGLKQREEDDKVINTKDYINSKLMLWPKRINPKS